MRLLFTFAFRYVFSKKKANAINIISSITAFAFAIAAAAMIIVLSALNGFESTLTHLFTAFDPALKIESTKGKTFTCSSALMDTLRKMEGIDALSEVLEDNAFVRYGGSQEIAIVKGVSENYQGVTRIDSTLIEGRYIFDLRIQTPSGEKHLNGGLFGYELANKLGLSIDKNIDFVTVYVPKKGEFSNLNPEQNLTIEKLIPTAKFLVQEEIDSRFIIVSLAYARALFGIPEKISALEIALGKDANMEEVKARLKKHFGANFSIKNQYEQKESIYKIFKSEKITTFAILSFILLIAAFNMSGALTMLIIEKEKDIAVLKGLGFTRTQIRSVFIVSGIIIAFAGATFGILVGGMASWLQDLYGFIRIENSIVEAYPVAIKGLDFLWVLLISLAIGLFTSWIPSRRLNY